MKMKLDMAAIAERVEKKLLTVQKHPRLDLHIFNYTHQVQYDRLWDEWTQVCRGLIADGEGIIVARPFPKFFNIGETEETKPEHLPAEVPVIEEKMDGSLGILYFEGDDLNITTRGSFGSPQAEWATKWIRTKGLSRSDFDQTATYLFEIIYPGNRIVVDYKGREELVLLSVRETKTGQEKDHHAEAKRLGFAVPRTFDIKDLQHAERELESVPGLDLEGFVVRYSNGVRAKLKSSDYKRLHRILTATSTVAVWEMLASGGSIEDLLKSVPDEFYKWLRKQVDGMNAARSEIMRAASAAHDEVKNLPTRKEKALNLIRDHPNVKAVVFKLMDGNQKDAERIVWDMVRPTQGRVFASVGDDI
jgi:RNA ligase